MFRKPVNLLSIFFLLISAVFSNVFLPAQLVQAQASAPIPVGTIPGSGRHLTAPQAEVVRAELMEQGLITASSTEEEIQAAEKKFTGDFSKQTRIWVNAETQMKAEQRAADLGSASSSIQSDPTVQAVTTSIFALPVQFSTASETIQYSLRGTTGCVSASATGAGPAQGQIPEPLTGDNITLYYTSTQTSDPNFYKSLIFGPTGITSRGIDLTAYTVQDYYNHVAGAGNVILTGSVQNWVTVDHTEAFYGAPGCTVQGTSYDGGNIDNAQQVPVGKLVVDAIAKFNVAGVDWHQYDLNNDGFVDSFWLIHAGKGEESGGGDLAIWSQSSSLSNDGLTPVLVHASTGAGDRDIYVNSYTLLPENVSLGLMTAELGHTVFGLPDLSSSDHDNSIAFWSNLSNGMNAGPLNGAVPVGFSLYLKSVAMCGDFFCNWQGTIDPVAYDAPLSEHTIVQLEQQTDPDIPVTPAGSKGVRIDLPELTETIENPVLNGSGKAAWSGKNLSNATVTLDYSLPVPAAGGILTVDTFWSFEYYPPDPSNPGSDYLADYGAVMASSDNGATWTYLNDLDGIFNNSNPSGHPILRGTGDGTLRFDLSAYKGQSIKVRFAYITDASYTQQGWFLDNLKLDGVLLSDFENLDAFTNNGWEVVPTTKTYPSYYLVEWRNATKYDQMVQTAYVTSNQLDADSWEVTRVPYNIPGAVISYYNGQAPDNNYNLESDALFYPPSLGPKAKLLVVDMNPEALRFEDASTGKNYLLSTVASSYDAALTRQNSTAFNINKYYVAGQDLSSTNSYSSQTMVTSFNDARGYYAGYYFANPSDTIGTLSNPWGSTVIPARGKYSLRVTDYQNTLLPDRYGTKGMGYTLGDGNPGSNNVQYGVNIELTGKASDGTWGSIRVTNYSVDYAFDQQSSISNGNYGFTYTVTITNTGTEIASNMNIQWEASSALILDKMQVNSGALVDIPTTLPYPLSTLAPGASITLTFTGHLDPAKYGTPAVWMKFTPFDGKITRGPWTVNTPLTWYKISIPLVLK